MCATRQLRHHLYVTRARLVPPAGLRRLEQDERLRRANAQCEFGDRIFHAMPSREETVPAAAAHPGEPLRGAAWRMLALVSGAELLGMSLWFAGSAAAPQLTARWDLSPAQVGGLATAVQLGFVLGTALSALLNLADVVPARRLRHLCERRDSGHLLRRRLR